MGDCSQCLLCVVLTSNIFPCVDWGEIHGVTHQVHNHLLASAGKELWCAANSLAQVQFI